MKRIIILLMFMGLASCGEPSVEYNPEGSSVAGYAVTLFSDATGVTMTNASAVGTELSNNISRTYLDLTSYTQVSAQFSSSLASAVINCRIEYSLNNGTSWATLIPNFAAAAVANSHNNSAWTVIPDSAKAGVLVRALIVGDGALDPVIRYVRLSYY